MSKPSTAIQFYVHLDEFEDIAVGPFDTVAGAEQHLELIRGRNTGVEIVGIFDSASKKYTDCVRNHWNVVSEQEDIEWAKQMAEEHQMYN